MPARLKRIGIDLVDGDMNQLGLFERTGFETPFIAAQQCFQSTSETSLYSRSMTSMTSSV